jgi:hypothetical protein
MTWNGMTSRKIRARRQITQTLMTSFFKPISRRGGVSPPSSRDPWVFPGVARVVAIARVRVGRPNPYGDGNDDRPEAPCYDDWGNENRPQKPMISVREKSGNWLWPGLISFRQPQGLRSGRT